MRCPFCSAVEDKVVDTRPSDNEQVIRRRRECIGCGRRFTTYERVDEILPLVLEPPVQGETPSMPPPASDSEAALP